MKTGVSTIPCGVKRRPARAFVLGSVATISNFKFTNFHPALSEIGQGKVCRLNLMAEVSRRRLSQGGKPHLD